MYENIYREYIETYRPNLESKKKEMAIEILLKCIADKDNIISELNRKYEEDKYIIPVLVAKEFKKLFYENFEERVNYELIGKYYINSYMQKEIDTRCYPYIFEKNMLDAEMIIDGTIPNDIMFDRLMVKITGEVCETETSLLYRSYYFELNKILDKVRNDYMENFIRKYAEDILDNSYNKCEDIKEIVNELFFDSIGVFSTFRYLDDGKEFVWYVGWEGRPLNDILEMSKITL